MKKVKQEKKVYELICQITGNKPVKKDSQNATAWTRLLKEHMRKNATTRSVNTRIMECIDVLQAYSKFQFQTKVRLLKSGDHLNALALGINMLGEELHASNVLLREKETLLKEIHHRVKNNLQIISSLLSLQSSRTENGISNDIFREARARIKSIALVHEHLYSSSDISNINASDYITNLVDHVQSIYDPLKKIDLDLKTDKIALNIDLAIPAGLVINELISNAYKYAFHNVKNKRIIISMKKINGKEKKVRLEVADNGIGFPAGFIAQKSETLGLHLVDMLAEQLNGKMKITGKKGHTAVSIDFKAS